MPQKIFTSPWSMTKANLEIIAMVYKHELLWKLIIMNAFLYIYQKKFMNAFLSDCTMETNQDFGVVSARILINWVIHKLWCPLDANHHIGKATESYGKKLAGACKGSTPGTRFQQTVGREHTQKSWLKWNIHHVCILVIRTENTSY